MSEEIKFLSFEEARNLVAAIQEEENIREPDKRVLTAYNHENRELCWFDFDELAEAVGEVPKDQQKEAFQDYVLKHIPEWALDI
jgi:hypothetical protein